jgi:hypothetical protein
MMPTGVSACLFVKRKPSGELFQQALKRRRQGGGKLQLLSAYRVVEAQARCVQGLARQAEASVVGTAQPVFLETEEKLLVHPVEFVAHHRKTQV